MWPWVASQGVASQDVPPLQNLLLGKTEGGKEMKEKRCSKCGEVKPVGQFIKYKKNRDGHRGQCKECGNKARRDQRRENPDKQQEIERKHYANRSEETWAKVKKTIKVWRENNAERLKESGRIARIKYQKSWEKYLKKKHGDLRCKICGKLLGCFTGSKDSSVSWDHRNGGIEKIKYSPSVFLNSRPHTEKNISIWESCDFGILCYQCNIILPTKNREAWLEKVTQYIKNGMVA